VNAVEALRQIEAGLISRRQISTVNHEFSEYAAEVLPANYPPAIQQGWDAGWAAALRSVTSLLVGVQSEALREGQKAPEVWVHQNPPADADHTARPGRVVDDERRCTICGSPIMQISPVPA
jgi:hypothetical protein